MKNTSAIRTVSLYIVAIFVASACSAAGTTSTVTSDAEPALFDTTGTPASTQDFDLVEVTIDEIGVSTVAPRSWPRNPGGGFTDGVSEVGFFVVQTSAVTDPTIDGFERTDDITEGGHTWRHYTLDGGDMTQGLAVTEIGEATYGLVLQAPQALADQYLASVVTPALAAFEANEPTGAESIDSTSIEIDGRAVAYTAEGTGPNTVVFEAGLGNGMSSWGLVAPAVAEHASVFAYDRPGYGGSDLLDGPRDGATMVDELRELLTETGHEPPYVLVGHSLGGTLMDLYARTYPDEVAGVVLVDSRHHEFTTRCLAQLDESECNIPSAAELEEVPDPIRGEWLGLDDTVQQVADASAFPDVPLTVIVAGTSQESPGSFELWNETQQDYADMVAGSKLVVAEQSGHGIPAQQPDIVVAAIIEILEAS